MARDPGLRAWAPSQPVPVALSPREPRPRCSCCAVWPGVRTWAENVGGMSRKPTQLRSTEQSRRKVPRYLHSAC